MYIQEKGGLRRKAVIDEIEHYKKRFLNEKTFSEITRPPSK